jgi:uncharacterized OB-fold protein
MTISDIPFVPPLIDDESAPFWAGLAAGELRIQRCQDCGRRRLPPRPMCPYCHSLRSEWESIAPTGTIWSFVVVHPPVLPVFAAATPYNVINVTLDADPTIRLIGNLIAEPPNGLPLRPSDDLVIGAAVEAVILQVAPDLWLPRWRLRAGPA